jgi:hypothetical protein
MIFPGGKASPARAEPIQPGKAPEKNRKHADIFRIAA